METYYWGLYSYRGSYGDPFPHSLLRTRQSRLRVQTAWLRHLRLEAFLHVRVSIRVLYHDNASPCGQSTRQHALQSLALNIEVCMLKS